MNPIYIVLGGLFWRFTDKRVALWYTHKHVDWKLRIAELFAHTIFTASPESFRLQSEKLVVVGHGIDTDIMKPVHRDENDVFRIVSVGRLSPVKDYETLIRAARRLRSVGKSFKVLIAGVPGTPEQQQYADAVKVLVEKEGVEQEVDFVGAVGRDHLPTLLGTADLFVNMSRTGSLNKAVLEAMAAGVPTLSSNEAFARMLEQWKSTLTFSEEDDEEMTDRILTVMKLSHDECERNLVGN